MKIFSILEAKFCISTRPYNIFHITACHLSRLIFFLKLVFSSWPGLDHYCRTAFTILIKQILFKTKDAFSQAANHPARVKLEFREAHKEFTDQGNISLSSNHTGTQEEFEKSALFLFGLAYRRR